MKSLISFLYNLFILIAIVYHVWTCYIAYQIKGIIVALLTAILPVVGEIYWIANLWGRENYQTFIYTGFGIGALAILFTAISRD
ncbi:MAG: hypothetical protein ACK4HE_04385 [Chitinophagaceae bacterium]|jgi:hypothetical protein